MDYESSSSSYFYFCDVASFLAGVNALLEFGVLLGVCTLLGGWALLGVWILLDGGVLVRLLEPVTLLFLRLTDYD